MLRDIGHIEERDYQTYLDLFHNISNFMRRPNLIVFLDVTAEVAYQRLQMRNRDCETSVSLEYLQRLYVVYQDFINDISKRIPVIKVSYAQYKTAEEMASIVYREWEQMQMVCIADYTMDDEETE